MSQEPVKEGPKRITGAPFYPMIYAALAKTCQEHGYALAVHGSLGRDLDLIAVPWVEKVSDEKTLIDALIKNHDLMEGNPSQKDKPHGRRGYVFVFFGGQEGYIDFCVMPPQAALMSQPDEKCPHPEPYHKSPVDGKIRCTKCFGIMDGGGLGGVMQAPPIAQDTMREGPYKATGEFKHAGAYIVEFCGQFYTSGETLYDAQNIAARCNEAYLEGRKSKVKK